MEDELLLKMVEGRYARQMKLGQLGAIGQKKISNSSVAIVGCGALGSVSAELLARMGVGKILLIDDDKVDLQNLHRQAIYSEGDIEKTKSRVLAEKLVSINSTIKISSENVRLDAGNVGLLEGYDLVLDCTDNLDARLLLNEFCAKKHIPWVHAAASGVNGVVLPIIPGGPCFRCVFPRMREGPSCEEIGILPSASHVVASLQVSLAVRMLLGEEKSVESKMIVINAWEISFRKLDVKKRDGCEVCDGKYSCIGKAFTCSVKKCKTRKGWTVLPSKKCRLDLASIAKAYKVVMDTPILLVIEDGCEIIIHDYGELLFKGLDDEDTVREKALKIFAAGGLK